MKPVTLITGATSGIGLAAARLFAKNGFDIIICGRRKERLLDLQEELKSLCETKILQFDVRDRKAVEEAINSLETGWRKVEILINNAGNAHGLSPIQDGDIDDWDAMIDINVKGLLYVSKAVIPLMIANESGYVINVGSIAGKEVYANGNVYCASKHAVDAINNGMRLDLNKHGIRVSSINPGLVETEFSLVRFKGDEGRANSVYDGFQPLMAEDVAETILFMATRPKHVNLSDVMILPTAQASATTVHKNS